MCDPLRDLGDATGFLPRALLTVQGAVRSLDGTAIRRELALLSDAVERFTRAADEAAQMFAVSMGPQQAWTPDAASAMQAVDVAALRNAVDLLDPAANAQQFAAQAERLRTVVARLDAAQRNASGANSSGTRPQR